MDSEGQAPGDRRPIASRELPIFRRLAAGLVRRGVSANLISIAGMAGGVMAGAALALTSVLPRWERALWLAGAALTQLRLLANMLDGMVAVGSGTASPVGELYNEVPDRVADVAILAGLGLAAGGEVRLGLGAALAAVATAYVRAAVRLAGAPMDFGGPLAKPQRMFLVTATALYLAAAPAAWRPAWGADPPLGLPAAALALILLGSLATAAGRLARGARAMKERRP